ncbi:MAG: DedA family protein [Roseburia sp.]|nr:DedA family protein [Roseburia sp.]
MDVEVIMRYFADYGSIAIFVIVLLEYLNLPGFPAGVIMPLAGIWAARGELNFLFALLITVAAGVSGSVILYGLGRGGGEVFLKHYYKRFPKHEKLVEEKIGYLREKGCMGIFVSKLVPMVRTLISIPAGIMKMNFGNYVISSTLGVAVWNFVFVGAGYLFGDAVFQMF